MEKIFDKYVWQARIWPGFLTLLPGFAAALCWQPKIEDATRPLVGAALSAGIVALLASIARGAGKSAQERLIKNRGNLPTTVILRHSDPTLERLTKLRYHNALAKLVHGAKMPTPEEEARDAVAADQCYQGCVRWLLGKTREKKSFPLVFSENMEYGFRRNLFGLKPLGLAIAVASTCVCLAKLLINLHAGAMSSALEIACLVGCIGFVFAWTFVVNEGWVWQGGLAYALRLLEAIDTLQEPIRR